MLIVEAFHGKELSLVEKQLNWIKTLGAGKGHELLLAPNWQLFMAGQHKPLVEAMQGVFDRVQVMQPIGEDESGWPGSANFAWRSVVNHVTNNIGNVPFFWIEPDAVVLCGDAFTLIYGAWRAGEKPFMGNRVQLDDIPIHMTGIAVYHDVPRYCPRWAQIQFQQGYSGPQAAFDVQHASSFLPNATITPLIQHDWKPEPFTNTESLVRIKPEAVIYHQDKTGSLYPLFEEQFNVPHGTLEEKPVLQVPFSPTITSKIVPTGYPPNTVFTYYRPVEKIDETEQRAMIDLWQYSWRVNGWNPVVLSLKNVHVSEMDLAYCFSNLPSTNPHGYDQACFDRWVAVACQGGGFMADYDVMNNGMNPFTMPERLTVYQTDNACPSFVGGPAFEFQRMAEIFARRGKEFIEQNSHGPHVSDMHILQALPGEYDQKSLVKPYGGRGWGMARLVHFANQTMEGKKPRSKWIPHLMFQREPR